MARRGQLAWPELGYNLRTMRLTTLVFSVCAFLGAAPLAQADGILVAWSPQEIDGMSQARWSAAKTKTVAEILERNLRVKTWADAYEVLLGARVNLEDPDLVMASSLNSQIDTRLNLVGQTNSSFGSASQAARYCLLAKATKSTMICLRWLAEQTGY